MRPDGQNPSALDERTSDDLVLRDLWSDRTGGRQVLGIAREAHKAKNRRTKVSGVLEAAHQFGHTAKQLGVCSGDTTTIAEPRLSFLCFKASQSAGSVLALAALTVVFVLLVLSSDLLAF